MRVVLQLYIVEALTELKEMIPKALSFDRMVIVARLGVPTITPLEEA